MPNDILKEAEEATARLIPEKSRDEYLKEMSRFNAWKEEKKVNGITEDVVLSYMFNLSKKYKSSTLWTRYSMIKKCLLVYENINIAKLVKLVIITFHMKY